MDEMPTDAWLGGFVGILWLASVATWIGLFSRWQRRGAILDYEPRSPVPWGAPVALLAALFVAVSLVSSISAAAAQEPAKDLDALEVFQRLIGLIVFQTLLTAGVLFVVAAVYRVSHRDFGLPASLNELLHDVRIGIVAWLAVIVPVHGLQLLLLWLSGLHEEPPSHPLIKMVTSGEPNVTLLVLATIAAVVVAPLSEEILFRLLLQGWLQKWEDRRVRISDDGTPDEQTIQAWNTSLEDSTEPFILVRAAQRGLFGLPYGWLPILISSLLFAIAHFGYGPDPVAIFFLAIILGYIYQRTHRIIPCIVAHALFNSLAMLVLWRMVFFNAK